jgi:hypothetical protein
MDPISTASAGLMAGLNRFDSASGAASQAFEPGSATDPAGAIVEQVGAVLQVRASAAALRASERMQQQLLDTTV